MIRPFGARAARFIRRPVEQDATINILEGSIRSAKTTAVNAKLIGLLSSGWWPGGTGLITGASKSTVKTNMLNDLFSILTEKRYKYNAQSGELWLCGRPFRVAGAKDEGSWKYIAGSTVGLWLADEVGLYPKSFFEMASSRMSMAQSRMYGTTNPAGPHHYLKKDYIDNPALRASGDFWSDHFTLDDNPNITEEKKNAYKRMYTGVFYLRNILGLWVVAEGAIYRDSISEETFYTDVTRPIGLKSRGGHQEHWIAIDDGVVNPFVLIDIYDDGNTVWADRERYFDSRVTMRQLTDSDKADDIRRFINENAGREVDQREWPGIIIDPSAASLKAELSRRGFYLVDADNSVDEGIRLVSSMLNLRKLRINKDGCPNGVREMGAYAWDDKRAETGKEQPIKTHDHYCDALRYQIKTRINDWRLAA